MSEEQLKAATEEATVQLDDGVEEISEDDLDGVAGGGQFIACGETNPNSYDLP